MDGNIGKAIASMTIKQSYEGACVCVDLLRHFSWYSVSSFPASPTLLGLCVKRAEPWSTLEAATVATSNSLSSKCKVWVKQKAQETWQFLSPPSTLGPFIYFTGPLCLSVCWRSTLHPSPSSLPCVAIACCSMLPSPTFGGLCLHLSLHKNGQWRKHVLHFVSSVFIMSCLLSLAVFTPSSLVHKLLISWSKKTLIKLWKSTDIHH